MTIEQAAAVCGLTLLCGEENAARDITGVFCCDLLSWAMSRAPADSAWVTVMGNINAVAVAVLTDCACIVLAESAALDDLALSKAQAQGVVILRSPAPAFETALALHATISA